MVKFCNMCGNLFNHVINSDNQFIYQCELCGNIDENIEKCIVINELTRNAHDYHLNKNMIYDNTLPRTRNIKCPHCQNNTEIVIFQYNPDMLNVGYMCTQCQSYWKN